METSKNKRILLPIVICVIGLIIIAMGVYLFQATMWRTISIGLLIIGALIVIASIVAIIISFRKRD